MDLAWNNVPPIVVNQLISIGQTNSGHRLSPTPGI